MSPVALAFAFPLNVTQLVQPLLTAVIVSPLILPPLLRSLTIEFTTTPTMDDKLWITLLPDTVFPVTFAK